MSGARLAFSSRLADGPYLQYVRCTAASGARHLLRQPRTATGIRPAQRPVVAAARPVAPNFGVGPAHAASALTSVVLPLAPSLRLLADLWSSAAPAAAYAQPPPQPAAAPYQPAPPSSGPSASYGQPPPSLPPPTGAQSPPQYSSGPPPGFSAPPSLGWGSTAAPPSHGPNPSAGPPHNSAPPPPPPSQPASANRAGEAPMRRWGQPQGIDVAPPKPAHAAPPPNYGAGSPPYGQAPAGPAAAAAAPAPTPQESVSCSAAPTPQCPC